MTLTIAAGFELAPLQVVPAIAVGIAYAIRCNTLAPTSRAVPLWRQLCFHGALAIAVVVLASPAGQLSDELFVVHMAEHIVLQDVVALMLVLGLTAPLLAPVLRIKLFDRARALTNPLVALPLWAIDLGLWHLPALHDAAVRHSAVHALQHICFVSFGANMWMPLFGPLPQPEWFGNAAKLGYILLVRLFGAVLANVFLFGGGAFYVVYAAGEAAHHLSPADDQVAAGTVMMIWESILTISLACWLFLKAAREGEERQELLDYATRLGVPLTEQRAARAVRAGRGSELRERMTRAASG